MEMPESLSTIFCRESMTSCLSCSRRSNLSCKEVSSDIGSELVDCAKVENLERRESVLDSREIAFPLTVTKEGDI